MSRLIDADKLIKELHKVIDGSGYDEDYKDMGIDDFIMNQATVFNVEKVKEELKQQSYGIRLAGVLADSSKQIIELKDANKIINKLAKEYKQEPYTNYETVRSNRLDCEVPSDCFEDIKEVRVIDEWTEETKVFKEYSADTPQKFECGWILCSERLPVPGKRYLVLCVVNTGDIEEHTVWHAIYAGDRGWYTVESKALNIEVKIEVIAWQPLPEPYKPQQESKWKDKVMKHFMNVE